MMITESNSTASIFLGGQRRVWMNCPTPITPQSSLPPTVINPDNPDNSESVSIDPSDQPSQPTSPDSPPMNTSTRPFNPHPPPDYLSVPPSKKSKHSPVHSISLLPINNALPSPVASVASHPSPSLDSAITPSKSVSTPLTSDTPAVQGQPESGENVTSRLVSQPASTQLATSQPMLNTAMSSTSQPGLLTPTTPSNISQPSGSVGNDVWASWQERVESIKSKNLCYVTSYRLTLLSDACSYHDIFYLVLHQVFCLTDSSGTVDKRITSRFPISAFEYCRAGMQLLQRFLYSNTNVEPHMLFLFTQIPESVNLLQQSMPSWYSYVMEEVCSFLPSLVNQFDKYQIHELAMKRRYPPLLNELRALLKTNSLIMINMVFVAICQNIYDAKFQTKVLALFKSYLLLEDTEANIQDLIQQYLTIPMINAPIVTSDLMGQLRTIVSQTSQQQIQYNQSQYEQMPQSLHPGMQVPQSFRATGAEATQPSQGLLPASPYFDMGMYPHPDRANEWVLLPRVWASRENARLGSFQLYSDGKYYLSNRTYERNSAGQFLLRPSPLSPAALPIAGIPFGPVIQSQHPTYPYPVSQNPAQYPNSFNYFPSMALPQVSMNQSPYIYPLPQAVLSSQSLPAMGATARDVRGTLDGGGMNSRTVSGMVQPNIAMHPMNPQTVAPKRATPVCQSLQLAPPPSQTPQQSLVSRFPAKSRFLPPSGYRAPHTAQPDPTRLALHQLDLAEPMKAMMRTGKEGVEEPTSLYYFPYSLVKAPTFFHSANTNQTLTFVVSPQDASSFPRAVMSKGIPIIEYKAGCVAFHLRSISLRPSEKSSVNHLWSTMATCWPSVLYIIVNGIEMFVRRHVHNEKDLPLDITQHLRQGENKIAIKMILDQKECENCEYAFVVQSMVVAGFEKVCELVKPFSRSKFIAEVSRRLNQSSVDDDLAVVSNSLTVDLIDPLTQKIFTLPGRSINCQHLECFDIGSYILTKKCLSGNAPLKDNWRCPICKADARPMKLVYDEFFAELRDRLVDTKKVEGAQSIEIKANGVWSVNYAAREVAPSLQNSDTSKERIVIELDD